MNKKSLLAIILATLMLIVPGLGMVNDVKAETIKENPPQNGWTLNNVSVNGGDPLPAVSGGRQEYQIRSLRGMYDKEYKNYVEHFTITIKNPGKGTQRVIKTSRLKLDNKVGINGKDDSYFVNLEQTEVDNTRFKLNFYPGETGVEFNVEVKDLGDKPFNLSTRDNSYTKTYKNPTKSEYRYGIYKGGVCKPRDGSWFPREDCDRDSDRDGCPCNYYEDVSQGNYTLYTTEFVETFSLTALFYDRIYENFDDGLEITYPTNIKIGSEVRRVKSRRTSGSVNSDGKSDDTNDSYTVTPNKTFQINSLSPSYNETAYIRPTLSKDVQYKVTIDDEEKPVLEKIVKSGGSNYSNELDKVPRGAHIKFNNPYKKSDGGSTGGTVVVPGGDSSAVIELMKQIQTQITELEKKVAVLETKNTNIESQLKELKDKTVELENKNTEINSKLQSLETIKSNITNLQAEVNKLAEEKKTLEDKVNNSNTEIALTKEKISNLEKSLSTLTDKSEIEKISNSIKENKEKLEKLESSKAELEKSITNNTNKINEANRIIETSNQNIKDLSNSIKILENEKTLIADKIKEIINNGSEADKESSKLKEQIASLNSQLISLTQTLKESTEKQSKEVERQRMLLEKRVERLTKEVNNQSKLEAQIELLNKEIEALKKNNSGSVKPPVVTPPDKPSESGSKDSSSTTTDSSQVKEAVEDIIKYLNNNTLTKEQKEIIERLIDKQKNELTKEERTLLEELVERDSKYTLTKEELKELKELLDKKENSLTKEEKELLDRLIKKEKESLTLEERFELERLIRDKDKLTKEELSRLRELLDKKDSGLTEAEKALLAQLLEKKNNSLTGAESKRLEELLEKQKNQLTDKEREVLNKLLDKQNNSLTEEERKLLETLLSKELTKEQRDNITNIVNKTNNLSNREIERIKELVRTSEYRKLTSEEQVELSKLLEKALRKKEDSRPPFIPNFDYSFSGYGRTENKDSSNTNTSTTEVSTIADVIARNKENKEADTKIKADANNNIGTSKTDIINNQFKQEVKTEVVFPIDANYYIENGNKNIMDATTFARNGRTMLPIRYVANVLGFSVEWHQDTQTISFVNLSNPVLRKGPLIIDLYGNVKDGSTKELIYTMDQAPIIRDDRTYVSISNLIKAFGGTHSDKNTDTHTIEWDSLTKSAVVRKNIK